MNSTYRYDFNAKEHQPELGLNWHDYHARNYDAALGRWMNVDPLADQAPGWTPYRYGFNIPVRYIDRDGRLETNYEDEFGNLLAETNDGNDATVIIPSENVEDFLSDFESTYFMQRDGSSTNAEWISEYGTGMVAEEGAQIQPWAIEAMGYDVGDLLSDKINVAIGALSFSQGIKHKIIDSAVKGGKSVQGFSDYLRFSKGFGTGLGVISGGINTYQLRSGEMSGFQYTAEMISTGVSVKLPAWGIGWELGRIITQIPGYQENFRLPIRRSVGLD